MKKSVALLVLLLSVAVAGCSDSSTAPRSDTDYAIILHTGTGSDWGIAYEGELDTDLYGVTLVGMPGDIMVVGSKESSPPYGLMLRSRFGSIWNVIGPTEASFSQFLDISAAYVHTTAVVVGIHGEIYRTTDQGENWTEIGSPTSRDLFDVEMRSNTVGMIAGEDILLRSTDLGLSWTEVPNLDEFEPEGIAIGDDEVMYSVGMAFPAGKAEIIRSTDGGVTWSRGNYAAGRLKAVACGGPQLAVAVGEGGMIYRTEDGGNTWITASSGVTTDLNAVAEYGGNWVAVGSDGLVLHSNDHGQTWTRIANGLTTKDLHGIYMNTGEGSGPYDYSAYVVGGED